MNFQQLRIIREAVQRNYNLTEVASALYTSQSGVSKHIKDLEDELGIELFVRRGKRLLGLTEPGKELLQIVERMLLDAKNIKRLAEQFSNSEQGQLTIATTHTQARYALPQVVRRFKQAFPRVHLVLHQASPAEIVALLQSGEADIGIATEALDEIEHLVTFPYYGWHHAVVVPEGHPLAVKRREPLTVEELAEHPLITYHEGYTGRARIDATFAQAGLSPAGLGAGRVRRCDRGRAGGLILVPALFACFPNAHPGHPVRHQQERLDLGHGHGGLRSSAGASRCAGRPCCRPRPPASRRLLPAPGRSPSSRPTSCASCCPSCCWLVLLYTLAARTWAATTRRASAARAEVLVASAHRRWCWASTTASSAPAPAASSSSCSCACWATTSCMPRRRPS
jgi:LysR family cys regulon transcriptional activator